MQRSSYNKYKIVETNDIKFTLDQFTRNRHVIEMESKEIKG